MGLQCRRPYREDSLEKEMATHSSREKRLASYSLWGRKEPDRTERLNHQHPGITMQCIHCTPRDISKRIKNISTQKLVHECSRQHDSQ